jgi:ParB-like chromosome segregation protein Spo0J
MLGAHPRVPFSAVTLWRHVRVYEMVRRMPGLARCEQLTITHMQAVLGLSHDRQERLLQQAAKEKWSAAQLRQHARAAAVGQTREAPAKHPVLRTFRRFERLQTELDPASFASLVGSNAAQRERIKEAVNRTRAWCDAMETLLVDDSATRH